MCHANEVTQSMRNKGSVIVLKEHGSYYKKQKQKIFLYVSVEKWDLFHHK